MAIAILVVNVITVSLLVLLCIGFTFTFMMDKFPNFAHTAFAGVGAMLAFALVRIYGFNPYHSLPLVTLLGGLMGVGFYLGLVEPIKRQGRRLITLTFLVVSHLLGSASAMFSYWILRSQGYSSGSYALRGFDSPGTGSPASPSCPQSCA